MPTKWWGWAILIVLAIFALGGGISASFMFGKYSASTSISTKASVSDEDDDERPAPPSYKGGGPKKGRLIDGPRQRGNAEAYCMRMHPHWERLMQERECVIAARHGPGGTNCRIRCD